MGKYLLERRVHHLYLRNTCFEAYKATSIEHYLKNCNQNPKPFHWHKKAKDILASVARAARVLVK